ncbi:NAD(P)-dependent oxidoreductase [Epibacterium ulvae]|nr:NAD(P)-dependent oxidoreductase [Epibacterium ulvae]
MLRGPQQSSVPSQQVPHSAKASEIATRGRVFVTGSGGILGQHVCARLQEIAPGWEILRNTADLTDLTATTKELLAAGPLDLVIHLAALVPVDAVLADPAKGFAVNVGGTINLLAALAHCEDGGKAGQSTTDDSAPRARLLCCSSGHVYASHPSPICETDPTDPISVYGKSKLLAEQAAREICEDTGRHLCVPRLFSIHDPQQQGSFLRPTLERRLADADPEAPFELNGADSLRDFLTAETAAQILVDLALSEAEGVVNVGSGTPQRVADFAQSLAPFPLNIKSTGTPNNLVPDVSRLRTLIGENNV